MSYKINVYNLLSKANKISLKNEALAIPILEEALKTVQGKDDIKLEMHVRFKLAYSYLFAGQYENAVSNYSWGFEKADENSNNSEINEGALWQYDHLIPYMAESINIPLSEIKKVLEDMKKRCLANSVGLKYYYSLKLMLAIHDIYTDEQDIKKIYAMWFSEPENKYEGCIGCTLGNIVDYYIYIKNYENALKETKKLINESLTNRDYMCSYQPHSIYGKLIIAAIKMKNFDTAKEFHIKGYELVDGKREFIDIIAYHIIYLALVDVNEGIEVFVKNYPNSYISNTDHKKLYFYLAGYILFSKIEEKNIKQISMSISKDAPIFVDGEYDVLKLKQYFKNETDNLINAFDSRNESNLVSQHIKEIINICNCGIFKCCILKVKKLIQKVLNIFKH